MSKYTLSLQELFDKAKERELNKQYAEAIKIYQDIIRQNPKYKHAYTSLGNCYVFLKDSARAIKAFKKGIQLTGDIHACFNLGILYFHVKMYKRAAEQLSQVVKRVESKEAYLFLAKSLFMDKQFEESAKVLKTAYDKTKSPEFQEMLEKLKEQRLVLEEKFPGEKKVLDMIQKNPHVLKYYNMLTVHYLRNNQVEKAEAILKQAVENNPENIIASTNLAGFYFDRKKFYEAAQLLEAAVKLHPEDASVEAINCRVNLAHAYMSLGEKKKAVKTLEKAISLNPPNVNILKQMLTEIKGD
ncbi:MAG: tetratricopeptide repeat protein [Nanoarchaeota archaeon]